MRVAEMMHTPVVTCRPSARMGEVARLMRDRNVGAVLVVDEVGYLAGIVTDRDLAVRGIGAGRTADAAVEHVMSRDVATVPLDSDVAHAGEVMAKRMVRRLPVVDEGGNPSGMVTLDDLVRHLGEETDALVDTVVLQAARRPFV
ncbi:MAG: CBS domain-containing protein [Actinomycetota bacterium]|nr:CBS domain-containing protein [Actinomycetota bacterium]